MSPLAGRPRGEPDQATFVGRLAAVIRTRRERAKLTPAEVCKRLKIGASTYYRWESGERPPRTEDLPALAAALGCTVRQLMPPD